MYSNDSTNLFMKTILNNEGIRVKITNCQFDVIVFSAQTGIDNFYIWIEGKFHIIPLQQFQNN